MNSVLRLYPCGRHDILAEMFKARKYPATKGSAGDEEGSAWKCEIQMKNILSENKK